MKNISGIKAAGKGKKGVSPVKKGVKFSDDQISASKGSSMNDTYDAEESDEDDQETSL